MPKRLAVQCNDDVVRVVVADVAANVRSGSNYEITAAIAKPVPDDQDAADVLADMVTENQWQNCHASLIVGRTHVEVRSLELPPVPDDELPEMVRLQAVRSFAASGDRSTIDFVPLFRTEEGVKVLAASADTKTIAQKCGAAATAGLQVDRVSLQSMAVASLYRTISETLGSNGSGQTDLSAATVVGLMDNLAEIAVIDQSRLASIRTVRMPVNEPALDPPPTSTIHGEGDNDAASAAEMITTEIRRSRLACGCTTDGPVIFLCRDDDPLVVALRRQGSSIISVDPMTIGGPSHGAGAVGDQRRPVDFQPLPGDPLGYGFAALVALIDGESRLVDGHDDWNVNFLSPRKKVEPKPNRTIPILLAGLAAILVAMLAIAAYQVLASKDRQIAEIESQIDALQADVDDAAMVQSEVAAIEEFLDADVVWLDEIRRLAKLAPPSDQLILSDLRGAADISNGGGKIEIKGRVAEPSVLGKMAILAADQGRRVIGDGASEIGSEDQYRWGFNQTLAIDGQIVRDARFAAQTTAPETQNDAVAE